MTLPLSGNPIKFSQIQTEFGGLAPISLSEYYRDATKTTSFLQDSNTDMSGTTSPPTITSNSNIPTGGAIKISQFAGAREYTLTPYSYAGTGGLVVFLNQNGFSSTSGGITWQRYTLSAAITMVIPYACRLRIEPISISVQGFYDGANEYEGDDADWSPVYAPGYNIRDNLGNSVLSRTETIGGTQSNAVFSATTPAETLLIDASKVGTTYYLDLFVEGTQDDSNSAPLVSFSAISIGLATT